MIERDLLPSQDDPNRQETSYLAEVHTSDVHGAGTDADVSVLLFGDLGDSGIQPLNVSQPDTCTAASAAVAWPLHSSSGKGIGVANMLPLSVAYLVQQSPVSAAL